MILLKLQYMFLKQLNYIWHRFLHHWLPNYQHGLNIMKIWFIEKFNTIFISDIWKIPNWYQNFQNKIWNWCSQMSKKKASQNKKISFSNLMLEINKEETAPITYILFINIFCNNNVLLKHKNILFIEAERMKLWESSWQRIEIEM